jgi:hypothetical protein
MQTQDTMTSTPSEIAPLFDDFGRCLPTQTHSPAHAQSRRYFRCVQPELDFAAIHARTQEQFGSALQTDAQTFERRAQAIREKLEANPSTRALTQGVGVPFLLPQTPLEDVGTQMAQRFLPAVAAAYRARFPSYAFTDHNLVPLAGQLSIAAGSRHDRLIQAMAQADVVGWYFPALSEFSVAAAREQVSALPESIWLAGGADTCAALIGSPDLLLRRDGYPPLLWLGALDTDQAKLGYHFEAYGYNLTFLRRPHLGLAAEYWSHGLTVTDAT